MMKKEKITKKFTMLFQPSLFEDFLKCCLEEYKTPSIVIREIVQKYIREKNKK
jgi:hypothetical protein